MFTVMVRMKSGHLHMLSTDTDHEDLKEWAKKGIGKEAGMWLETPTEFICLNAKEIESIQIREGDQ